MTIFILTIEHKYGTNLYPCISQAAADHQLRKYVREWWSEEIVDECGNPPPLSEQVTEEEIRRYFEAAEEEYEVSSAELYTEEA